MHWFPPLRSVMVVCAHTTCLGCTAEPPSPPPSLAFSPPDTVEQFEKEGIRVVLNASIVGVSVNSAGPVSSSQSVANFFCSFFFLVGGGGGDQRIALVLRTRAKNLALNAIATGSCL